MDELSLLRISGAIASIGYILSDAELLTLTEHLGLNGLLSMRRRPILRKRTVLRRALSPVMLVVGLATLRLIVNALSLAVWSDLRLLTALWSISVLITFVLQFRGGLGNNGSDEMLLIVQVALFAGLLFRQPDVAALFISAQLSLSYLTAAIVKLCGKSWRDGSALSGVIHSGTFGHAGLSSFLCATRGPAFTCSWTVIILETACSMMPWLPPKAGIVLALLALGLHGSIAVIMGLNTFVPAFSAAFPAALYVSERLYRGEVHLLACPIFCAVG